jgi:flagellar biogenesis protein FliO
VNAVLARAAALMLSMWTASQTGAAAVTASSPASGAIPYMAEGPGVTSLALRVLGALLVCALAGWGLIQLLRTRYTGSGRATTARRLEVLEVRPMGGRRRLLVVRYEDQQLLLAEHEAGISLLRDGPSPGKTS